MQRTLICFDYGKKRIGVAVGQEMTHTASPLETLNTIAGEPDWSSISRIIEQWRPGAIIIGLPLNKDGSETDITKRVKQFSLQVQDRYNLPVYFTDERLSSVEAENLIENRASLSRKTRRDKGTVDKFAANIILQAWLDQNRR
jgi:putative Holliday junction resolvase